MIVLTVVIPTFRRPDSFLRAARSALAQTCPVAFEVVAVDNSPEGSAIDVCRMLAAETRAFRWTHAPDPGVANARNAAMALVRGAHVAFLDDDQEAPQGWLAALWRTHAAFAAAATFGPISGRAPEGVKFAAYFERLFARAGASSDALISGYHGIGNSMIDRCALLGAERPFDLRTNEIGGEDDLLFSAAVRNGKRMAWSAAARVIEHVPPARARLGYALRRAFAYGQGPCETAAAERRFLAIPRHMAIGAAQFAFFAPASLMALLGGRRDAIDLLDRCCRGAGKFLWFMKQRFYGAAA